jgi:hypothetical protein
MKAGITGHQFFTSTDEAPWVTAILRDSVRDYGVTYGFTCLAAGADQLFASVLATEGLPFCVVVPCNEYEAAFTESSDVDVYLKLLEHADSIVRLDYPEPSEHAFWAAGRRVVRESDVLFAVWDGKTARGLGGTGDVVAYALTHGTRVLHIDSSSRTVSLLQQ